MQNGPLSQLLADLEHPCQALADFMTIKNFLILTIVLTFIGDGNNVANSVFYVERY